MATKVKWAHVYDDDNKGKYVGFFVSRKDAEAWVKKQQKRKLRISDERPTIKTATKTTIDQVDQGLDAALAAVKGRS